MLLLADIVSGPAGLYEEKNIPFFILDIPHFIVFALSNAKIKCEKARDWPKAKSKDREYGKELDLLGNPGKYSFCSGIEQVR